MPSETSGSPTTARRPRAFFASVDLLACSFQAATVWGEIQADAGCADALADQRRLGWIAACCLAVNSRLRRFNVKDYADFASTRALRIAVDRCT